MILTASAAMMEPASPLRRGKLLTFGISIILMQIDNIFRCNGNNDCNDASDEVNCDKISVPETYLPDVPPPPIEDNLLADIFVSIDVMKVLNLVEVDESMVLKYRLTLKWKDSRVQFRNLKKENYLNSLGPEEAGKIWYPRVVFYNTRDTEETKVLNKFVMYLNK